MGNYEFSVTIAVPLLIKVYAGDDAGNISTGRENDAKVLAVIGIAFQYKRGTGLFVWVGTISVEQTIGQYAGYFFFSNVTAFHQAPGAACVFKSGVSFKLSRVICCVRHYHVVRAGW
jgi:hypothetical protein